MMSLFQLLKRILYRCYVATQYCQKLCSRYLAISQHKRKNDTCKVYYGCGDIAQSEYINIDVRYTSSVDLIGDLFWCRKSLRGYCKEVYISHVLEHYRYPGKSMSKKKGTVLHALDCIYDMLIPGGQVRIAVPDFSQLSLLYHNRELPLYPKISGRLCGEQDYHENLHKCVFDREFLEICLYATGFFNIREWTPDDLDLIKDSSFDSVNGYNTSLNLIAEKPVNTTSEK